MNLFERPRWAVVTQRQHPYRHDLTEFFYSNPAVPLPVNNTKEALDYLFAVVYPNYIGTFATVGDLPVSASANDYAVVSDDGDGKSAGYVWLVRDGAAGWSKRYDVDWSMEGILAETVNRTFYMYVHKYGMTDKDAAGDPVTGVYAGQSIYGGDQANQHLTLHPNSGDTLGTYTGFVQTEGSLRPTVDDEFELGTATERWADLKTVQGTIGDISISAGVISSAGGTISFVDNDLGTTGSISSADLTTSTVFVTEGLDTLEIDSSSIVSTTGAIDFGGNDFSGVGNLGAETATFTDTFVFQISPDNGANATSLSTTAGIFDFDGADLQGIDDLSLSGAVSAGSATFGNIEIAVGDANLIGTSAGSLEIAPAVDTLFTAGNIEFDGTDLIYRRGTQVFDGSGVEAIFGNVTLAVGVIGTNAGNLSLEPATGVVLADADFRPSADNTYDLGAALSRWQDLFLSGGIGDGSNAISIGTLLSFRDALSGASAGDALFYDGSKWVASNPDTEIAHSELAGLTTADAGHTQFAMLAGRSGGQTLIGGTGASENLTLQSTSNGTRGQVRLSDDLAPATTGGASLGTASLVFADVRTSGQFYGMRLENRTSDPGFSAGNVGRLIYRTDTGEVRVDTGSAWKAVGSVTFTNVGSTPNSAGASVANGTEITLQPASGTSPGVMTASTQILGGAKTWNGGMIFASYLEGDSVEEDSSTTGANQTLGAPTKITKVIDNVSLTSVAGVTNPGNSRIFILVNSTGNIVTIANQSGSATGANRIVTGTGADILLKNGASLFLVYNTLAARWYVVGGSGGSSTPTQFGSTGSPRSVVIATGIVSGSSHMSTTESTQDVYVEGSVAGENDITANPQIQAHTIVGARMRVIGAGSNAVVLEDGNGLSLRGPWYGNVGSTLDLYWNGTVWAESGRNS